MAGFLQLLFLLIFIRSGAAGQFHVSPAGTANGNGSSGNPWNLQTALNHPAAVRPGDTIWVHGGLYAGFFRSYLNGTPGSPIIVRQFPGERAVFDNVGGTKEFGLHITGSHTWFWGMEVRNTSSSIWNISGVAMAGPGEKLINMVIHDNLATGVTSFSSAADGEVYGCLIYYNGRETEDPTNRGYGIYTQNDAGRVKAFKENIIPYSWGFGIHAYTEGNRIDDFLWEGNVVYNSGILWRGVQFERNFFIGSATVVADANTYRDNHSYYPASPSAGARNTFGYFAGTTNLMMKGNWFVGGAMDIYQVDILAPGMDTSVTRNTFYRTNGFTRGGNTYLTSPSGTNVFVRPNAYEPGRANIIIYNWSRAATVNVNVAAAGLQAGDRYEVRDALNWPGLPVASGQYNGGTIAIPMTGLTVTPPVGNPAVAPAHTAPEFGAFLLIPARTTSAQRPSGSFDASPDTLPPAGGNVTLTWSSQNATFATIDQGIGVVPADGNATVLVTSTRIFTLTLTGPGGTASYSTAVVVPGSSGSAAPPDFLLEQNFPNPFNPDTRIVFKIPAASPVTLTVHDLLGREVARLVTGHLGAGTYTVDFSARGLASGVYFYTIKADDFEEVRKMIVER